MLLFTLLLLVEEITSPCAFVLETEAFVVVDDGEEEEEESTEEGTTVHAFTTGFLRDLRAAGGLTRVGVRPSSVGADEEDTVAETIFTWDLCVSSCASGCWNSIVYAAESKVSKVRIYVQERKKEKKAKNTTTTNKLSSTG